MFHIYISSKTSISLNEKFVPRYRMEDESLGASLIVSDRRSDPRIFGLSDVKWEITTDKIL